MEGFKYIKMSRQYLNYLEEHLLNIQKAWHIIRERCSDMNFIYDDLYYWTLDGQIKNHDLSKFSQYEFVQYREFFYPVEGAEPVSINKAFEHHKEHNNHHWETWTYNKNNNKYNHPCEWEIHCVHMVVDWLAMSYKFNDTAQIYYEKNKDKIKLPEYAIKFIYEIFDRIYR